MLGSALVIPLIETNPLRRGGPLRPPARIDTVLLMLMLMLMPMLRLPGGCIVCVPISPDVMKIPFCLWFGFAGLLRSVVMWGDHPRWSRLGLFGIDLLILTIDDGARPASRRMSTG